MSDVADFNEYRRRRAERRAATRVSHPSGGGYYENPALAEYYEQADAILKSLRMQIDWSAPVMGARIDEILDEREAERRRPIIKRLFRGTEPDLEPFETQLLRDTDAWRDMCARVADASRRVTWTDPDPARAAETQRAIELIEQMGRPS